jgi:hypothetical protein
VLTFPFFVAVSLALSCSNGSRPGSNSGWIDGRVVSKQELQEVFECAALMPQSWDAKRPNRPQAHKEEINLTRREYDTGRIEQAREAESAR